MHKGGMYKAYGEIKDQGLSWKGNIKLDGIIKRQTMVNSEEFGKEYREKAKKLSDDQEDVVG